MANRAVGLRYGPASEAMECGMLRGPIGRGSCCKEGRCMYPAGVAQPVARPDWPRQRFCHQTDFGVSGHESWERERER